jgi:arabinose-5-phosphate isomerase
MESGLNEEIMTNSEILTEVNRVIDEEISALQNSKKVIAEEFSEAVRIISTANKVILTGVGKSGLIARKIAATLSSLGVSSAFLHPVEALHGDIGMVQNDDVVILLSKSGNTEELVKLLPYIKMRSAKIISILGNVKSTIARFSDIVLNASVEREACPFNLAPSSSSTLALAFGDALAIASMKLRKLTLEEFSKLHPLGQIGRAITVKVVDIMHSGDELPLIFRHNSFRDALIEITNKDLGCVCVIEDNFTLTGIITDGDVRRILQKTEDMRGLIVGNIMTSNPITIDGNAFINEALAVMENRDSEINVLPVIDEGNKLIGVIRLHDIVQTGS